MRRIGLKLWSTNENYLSHATRLFEDGYCDYIELYIKPASGYLDIWERIKVPFIIHAPHFGDGVNLSLPENIEYNMHCYELAAKYADRLDSKTIIFHPGVGGNIKETVRQLQVISDKRIVIENKPQYGLKMENCVGHSYEEIDYLLKNTGLRFCLDIGHAICSANSKRVDYLEFISKMILLGPSIYHLTDGDIKSELDRHDHYGEGTYPLDDILRLMPSDCIITNEAKKDSDLTLDCFIKDVEFLRKLKSF